MFEEISRQFEGNIRPVLLSLQQDFATIMRCELTLAKRTIAMEQRLLRNIAFGGVVALLCVQTAFLCFAGALVAVMIQLLPALPVAAAAAFVGLGLLILAGVFLAALRIEARNAVELGQRFIDPTERNSLWKMEETA